MGLATGARGGERLLVMQMHRLLEFQKVFDLYLSGKVDAKKVKERAQKMLDVGLPSFK